ncbi:beta-1,6-N-acetylglucosaminyltransferase [Acinetobacter lactucae]|uniref:beta-1,6-N-acetylglucosaminyltransferase n=1 Tax=Acinetobacter lactucae TaxID=1785128 RepID=UPI0015811D6D|nr:beta-1,6-N-acetylglucosaminyltransferase [Acinetobacter lactucae]NUF16159.1 conjugal transfer protein [Acinetobacter lactucae]NUG24313.1 conjugal transfer protein [Acinetobacter lactucae]
MMKHAFLILTHKPIDHIYQYANYYKNCNFYIHVDKKSQINSINTKVADNVFFLPDTDRIDITWAGFSMIEATINLINFALNHDENNSFFHLISGDDVILKPFDEFSFNEDKIYMECYESPRHRYRVRFDTPHADTKHQRKPYGKALTIFYKLLDKLIPSDEKCLFGSQWFSIGRKDLEVMMSSANEDYLNSFRRKLCPDEHFFQYLVKNNNLIEKLSEDSNKRFIVFDDNYQHGSSPIFLDLDTLKEKNESTYWFSRKVQPDVISEFIKFRGLGLK